MIKDWIWWWFGKSALVWMSCSLDPEFKGWWCCCLNGGVILRVGLSFPCGVRFLLLCSRSMFVCHPSHCVHRGRGWFDVWMWWKPLYKNNSKNDYVFSCHLLLFCSTGRSVASLVFGVEWSRIFNGLFLVLMHYDVLLMDDSWTSLLLFCSSEAERAINGPDKFTINYNFCASLNCNQQFFNTSQL